MKTDFTLQQLTDRSTQIANDILRKCVHCGFCTATCPTYVTLGDELDSPRGRIYLIKNMMETDQAPSKKTVGHIDKCLSCLSCMTTCPASVHYMHLVDIARTRIEETYIRPLPERLLRMLLALVLPRPGLFRMALLGAKLGGPLMRFLPGRLGAMMALAPDTIEAPSPIDQPQTIRAKIPRLKRVVLMNGCAQQVLKSSINEATARVLTKLGCDVVIAGGAACCGALVHHMGQEQKSHLAAKNNIQAWENVKNDGGLDAIVINASGCGTMVKDYGFMLSGDENWAERAKVMSDLTRDITEFVLELDPDFSDSKIADEKRPIVAYHSACSMQHGQKLSSEPVQLLKKAGFDVRIPKEGHLCCGSAGTYNIMQPEIAGQLQKRKTDNILNTNADVVASGNIGCIVQITGGMKKADDQAKSLAVVHTVELIDWVLGGVKPEF